MDQIELFDIVELFAESCCSHNLCWLIIEKQTM